MKTFQNTCKEKNRIKKKRLQDSVKIGNFVSLMKALNSINAYIGCISGAILKEEYIRLINNNGFRNINITNERSFSVDFLVNDPSILKLIKELNISNEILDSIKDSVVSIEIIASKY